MFHEYAHHFLLQNFTVAYPKWYVEGFAEYVQTAEIAPERVTWGRYSEGRVAYSIAPAIWPPMERMLRGNYRESETGPFYALSWLMTHYFNHQPERRAGLLAYFEKLRQGGDPVTEFPNAIGVSLEEFERELREYLRGRITYHVMTQAPRSASAISISRLPEAADDLLTLTARIRFGRSEADRPGLLDRVRRIAERHPNEEYAQRELARAEIALGSPVAGRARLEPLLSRNGENAEALYLTGLSYVMEGRADEARRADLYRQGRRFFSRVYRINPDHVPTLYRYVETYSAEPGPLTAQQLDVLVHARNLAPQVAEIGLNTGAQLMAAQRLEEATAVLRQIAYNPHGGDASKRALEMLAEAERRAGEGSESSQPAGD